MITVRCASANWAWADVQKLDIEVCQQALTSVAVLAEVPLRSPQKIFIFIIKKKCFWVKVSKNKII